MLRLTSQPEIPHSLQRKERRLEQEHRMYIYSPKPMFHAVRSSLSSRCGTQYRMRCRSEEIIVAGWEVIDDITCTSPVVGMGMLSLL